MHHMHNTWMYAHTHIYTYTCVSVCICITQNKRHDVHCVISYAAGSVEYTRIRYTILTYNLRNLVLNIIDLLC